MGQVLVRGTLQPSVAPFINLSSKSISSLWQNFNDFADGFGITASEFQEICLPLHEDLGCSKSAMKQRSADFFVCLDTDKNGLIGKKVDYIQYCYSIQYTTVY